MNNKKQAVQKNKETLKKIKETNLYLQKQFFLGNSVTSYYLVALKDHAIDKLLNNSCMQQSVLNYT